MKNKKHLQDVIVIVQSATQIYGDYSLIDTVNLKVAERTRYNVTYSSIEIKSTSCVF